MKVFGRMSEEFMLFFSGNQFYRVNCSNGGGGQSLSSKSLVREASSWGFNVLVSVVFCSLVLHYFFGINWELLCILSRGEYLNKTFCVINYVNLIYLLMKSFKLIKLSVLWEEVVFYIQKDFQKNMKFLNVLKSIWIIILKQ